MEENVNDLINKFSKEFKTYGHYLKASLFKIYTTAFDMICDIANLPYDKICIEISPLNSIKFSMLFRTNKLLIITKIFNIDDDIVVFSYFINRECLINDTTQLYNIIDNIDLLLKIDVKENENTINKIY